MFTSIVSLAYNHWSKRRLINPMIRAIKLIHYNLIMAFTETKTALINWFTPIFKTRKKHQFSIVLRKAKDVTINTIFPEDEREHKSKAEIELENLPWKSARYGRFDLVAKALNDTSLKHINLTNCRLRNVGLALFTLGLKGNTTLTSINLSSNMINCEDYTVIQFLKALEGTNVTYIDLSGNYFAGKGDFETGYFSSKSRPINFFRQFGDALKNTNITDICLAETHLTNKELVKIGESLKGTKITSIDLSGLNNKFDFETIIKFIRLLQKTNVKTLKIDLTHDGVNQNIATEVSAAFRKTKIKGLSLIVRGYDGSEVKELLNNISDGISSKCNNNESSISLPSLTKSATLLKSHAGQNLNRAIQAQASESMKQVQDADTTPTKRNLKS